MKIIKPDDIIMSVSEQEFEDILAALERAKEFWTETNNNSHMRIKYIQLVDRMRTFREEDE